MIKGQTDIIFIVDKSSSMTGIREEMLSVINGQIREAKEKFPGDTTTVTWTVFASGVQTPVMLENLSDIQEIPEDKYKPEGMTALWDAVGLTINRFEEKRGEIGKEDAVLCLVFTDGMENMSRTFSVDKIRKMVADREAGGHWTFSFHGASEAILDQADTIGINYASTQTFDTNNMSYFSGCATSNLGDYSKIRAIGATRSASYNSNR